MEKKIKWCAVQPLTGGMYFGAEKAIGHPADFILSYPGLDGVKRNKNGEIVDSGNEYGLLKYLKEHDRLPAYYNFKRELFNPDFDLNPEIVRVDDVFGEHTTVAEKPDYSDMDLVVAVPVCAGLSTFTAGTAESRETRNCNMRYLARYILQVIQPKVYIFENAPGLMGARGDGLRVWFQDLATELGYSIVFYKTDTQFHDNCQRRQRTFVYFFKNRDDLNLIPNIDFEQNHVNLVDYMSRIPAGATQTETRQAGWNITVALDFIREKYGNDWRDKFKGSLGRYIDETSELREQFIEFVQNGDYEQKVKDAAVKHMAHVDEKCAAGKGWWNIWPIYYGDYSPAVMNKTQQVWIHYKEDRLYNVRELLHLMGMPNDYEFQGREVGKIGQNVPARTAQFIVEQGMKYLSDDNPTQELIGNMAFFDNIKVKRIV